MKDTIIYIACCLFLSGCTSPDTNKRINEQPITIGLMGDVMIGRSVNEPIQQNGYDYVWGTMLPLLHEHDFNLINLETTLTRSTHAVPKVFNFKSNPLNVQTLVNGNITITNIANNHILDFNVEGLKDTLQTLDTANIKHVGAGMSLHDAQKACIIERNGIRIGIIGATDNEPPWAATDNTPGTNYFSLNDYNHLIAQIRTLRPYVDCLIVSLHWGPNWPEKPSTEMITCAHDLIDAGADIIHGHSPHITLGIEQYNNKLIIYSAGDFIDDYMIGPKERNDHAILFRCIINKQGIKKLILIPGIIQNMQVNRAYGNEGMSILSRMQKLSQELHTSLTYDPSNEVLIASFSDF